ELLWPDAEGDLAHKAYGMACVRLRKIIGGRALRISGGHAALDEKYCWTDLKAVLRIMAETESLWEEDAEKAILLTEKAMAMHKGDFLSSDPGQPWAMTVRERVRTRLMGLIAKSGEHFMRTGRWDAAVRKFEKALELDNLAEEFYQNLMRCQINSGRRAEAARTYVRCRRALSETLGISPSRTTTGIYNSLSENK
ncbi:MAG: bacterial transcriptional activator domain-containing protein, partial [Nitrospiraceae bacterium]|nr:bacterial transcriptional activator domain-containing protein [Nitrospiraceae bacterium]